MTMRRMMLAAMATGYFVLCGCMSSTHNATKAPDRALAKESTVVFVRPTQYSMFGTRSIRDYVEVIDERSSPNAAGLLVVQLTLRNRGGQHIWDTKGPDFSLSVKTAFYDEPLGGETRPPPVYETNWETVRMLRGASSQYKVTCPKPNGRHYQVTIAEWLK